MTMRTPFILEARNVSFRYPDGTTALSTISTGIRQGEKIAVLGANGCGKTTLFLHFNGIFKPSRGAILFNDTPLMYDRRSLRELRSQVQIVFQEPDMQLFSARVYQDISFGALNLGLPQDEVRRRVESALHTTDIEHLRDKPTHFLSHGEKKRVAIAGALVMEPQVLIMDEPTACLDPHHQLEMLDLFDKLNQRGATILLSTHDVELAWQWAGRIIVMYKGAVAREGEPHSVFCDMPLLEKTGLSKPLALEVFDAVRQQTGLAPDSTPPRTKQALLAMLNKKS
jgi:cobalt/nickel transport system ATP-binding protein